jgi:hypothetical protein
MVPIDVVVMLRGTIKEIAGWRFEIDRDGQLFTHDRYENRLSLIDSWQQLALDINQRACESSHLPIDVFLILRGHLLENLYDANTLAEIVNNARTRIWGGNIYIVWDQRSEATFDRLYKGNEAVLKKWFHLLVQSNVTDLIEIKKKNRLTEPDEKKILYERALESERRRRMLEKLVREGGWQVILRDGARFLDDFIRMFARPELQLPSGENMAVFYDQRPPHGWGQLLERARLYNHNGNLFVAALSRSNANDVRDLEELWKQESTGGELLLFKGIFEWLYTFIRLAQASRPSALAQTANLAHDDIVWVEPAQRLGFDLEADSEVHLLITTAFTFHPAEENSFYEAEESAWQNAQAREEAHCLDAAKEIGEILRHLPFYVKVEVYHCITCEQLPRLLENKEFTAWIHLGHGDEQGLIEEKINRKASHQRWVDCFNDYERGLSLVIFSACESASLARSFAEEGIACVAIGFENKVLTEATWNLSGRVIPAVLRASDRQQAILHAFLEAVVALRRRSYEEHGVDKHYSDARPKAFAIKRAS